MNASTNIHTAGVDMPTVGVSHLGASGLTINIDWNSGHWLTIFVDPEDASAYADRFESIAIDLKKLAPKPLSEAEGGSDENP